MAVDAGYMPAETAKSFVERYKVCIRAMLPEAIRQKAYTGGGLVSMQLMLVARSKGYDTVPIDSYDKQKFMEAFRISERYVPIMLIAIGINQYMNICLYAQSSIYISIFLKTFLFKTHQESEL